MSEELFPQQKPEKAFSDKELKHNLSFGTPDVKLGDPEGMDSFDALMGKAVGDPNFGKSLLDAPALMIRDFSFPPQVSTALSHIRADTLKDFAYLGIQAREMINLNPAITQEEIIERVKKDSAQRKIDNQNRPPQSFGK